MQTDFRPDDLAFARALADLLLEQFEDREHGGFYFTSHDHERLIHRAKTGARQRDAVGQRRRGATRCSGSATSSASRATSKPPSARSSSSTTRSQRSASGHVSLLAALEEALAPPRIVVLRGAPEALAPWQARLAGAYRPDTLVVAIPDGVAGPAAGARQARAGRGRACQRLGVRGR